MDKFLLKSDASYREGWLDACDDLYTEWERIKSLCLPNDGDIVHLFEYFIINYSGKGL